MPPSSVRPVAREDALLGRGFKPFGYPDTYAAAYGQALLDRSVARRVAHRFGSWLVYRAVSDRSRRRVGF